MNKKIIAFSALVAIAALGGNAAQANNFCTIGQTTSTESCVNITTTCPGAKLATGTLCTTTNYSCVATANSLLRFPQGFLGEWRRDSSTETFTPNYDSECPGL